MSESRTEVIGRIISAIKESHSFLVATHVHPDGDAVGSVLAMTFILRRLGKEAHPYCQDPVPPGHDFLPGVRDIRSGDDSPSRYDAAILVDCGDFHRVGPALAEAIRQVPFLINIDHHVSSSPFGNVYWVEPSASSTCEMLYDLCLHLPLTPDPDIASQLYTGILTDTGSFRFSNTTGSVLQKAAELVELGAQPDHIAGEIFESASPQRLKLLAKVLSTVSFHDDNRLAIAEITSRMFEETRTTPADSEGFINNLRAVKSVRLAILFREDSEGLVHVSMRSKPGVDAAAFAQRHDGGGHHRAAAFRLSGPMEAIRQRITREALEYIRHD